MPIVGVRGAGGGHLLPIEGVLPRREKFAGDERLRQCPKCKRFHIGGCRRRSYFNPMGGDHRAAGRAGTLSLFLAWPPLAGVRRAGELRDLTGGSAHTFKGPPCKDVLRILVHLSL